ncbi:hypothetical protein [Flavobacterium sp. 3HN19-14]|uniref:hypothetical protein n=1 Tax=Flavobacterium sp. 3HN19-14 TaxID=3448133 RepID=UPI003EE1ED79
MKIKTFQNIAFASLFFSGIFANAQTNKYVLDFKDTGVKIEPTMYGIFFEDINFAADGGLYAEMVKNRSFEFQTPLMGWEQPSSDRHSLNEKSGYALPIETGDEKNKNICRIEVKDDKGYSLINEGFRGMGIKANDLYNLSIMAENREGNISKIKFQFIDEKEMRLAKLQSIHLQKNGKNIPRNSKPLKPKRKPNSKSLLKARESSMST